MSFFYSYFTSQSIVSICFYFSLEQQNKVRWLFCDWNLNNYIKDMLVCGDKKYQKGNKIRKKYITCFLGGFFCCFLFRNYSVSALLFFGIGIYEISTNVEITFTNLTFQNINIRILNNGNINKEESLLIHFPDSLEQLTFRLRHIDMPSVPWKGLWMWLSNLSI